MKAFFRATPHQISGLIKLTTFIPKGAIGVEVGSGYGESMVIFMESGRVKEMLCVDTWAGDKAEREAYFDRQAARWQGFVHKAKASSLYVASGMRGNPQYKFDFVYVDACHTLPAVGEDIKAWLPLVNSGGILAGHDYRNDVKKAVDEILGGPDRTFEDSSWLKFVK